MTVRMAPAPGDRERRGIRARTQFFRHTAIWAFSVGLVLSHEFDHKFPTFNPTDNGPGGVIDFVNGIQKELGLPTRDLGSHQGVCGHGNCSVSFHDASGQQHLLKWQMENQR